MKPGVLFANVLPYYSILVFNCHKFILIYISKAFVSFSNKIQLNKYTELYKHRWNVSC